MAKNRREDTSLPGARAPRPRSSDESREWSAAAADAGVPVEQLMREVAQFRVALEADMTIAAAAAELGDEGLVGAILDSERDHVAEFEARATGMLSAPQRKAPRMSRGKVLVATAASLALITGLGTALNRADHQPAKHNQTTTLALAAAARYADFTRLASSDSSAQQIIEAAALLHQSLAQLVLGDPTAAPQVANILNSEQQQLLRYLPPGTTTVLTDAKALVARLSKSVQPSAAKVISKVQIESPPTAAQPTQHPSKQPTAKPSSSPKPQPSSSPPSPKPQPSSSPASPKPSSSGQPTPPPFLPGANSPLL